jgi:peptide/nickel transport system ATP-binding protein
MSTKEEPLVMVRNIIGGYVVSGSRGFLEAVSRVTLDIHANEIIGIAGESGCGKSTLVKIMYGFIRKPLVLTSGKIYVKKDSDLLEITSMDEDERRKKIWWRVLSYIPQNSMSVLNPVKRIKDHFIEILKAQGRNYITNKDAIEAIASYMEEIGLPREVLNAYPHQLSGGMRQRVVTSMALIMRPRVVLADEPTTGLDVVVQRGIIQNIVESIRRLGSSLVLVSHDIGLHAMITDRMAIMYAGKIVEVGRTIDILRKPLHPYTQALLESLPRLGDKKPREGLRGMPPNLISPPPGCRFHPRCPFAMDICKKVEPGLVEVEPGRLVSCHIYRGEEHRR